MGGISRHRPKLGNQGSFKSCPRVGGIVCHIDEAIIVKSFKSCPRVGGIRSCFNSDFSTSVSSRAPVWGASFSVPCSGACWEFQVVPPCGGHLQIEAIRYTRIRSFKSCPRVGGIFLTRKYVNPYKLFQVVPPCGGHPAVLSGFFVLWILVSSRAPVWGASFLLCFFGFIPFSVSSRAPVWGASEKMQSAAMDAAGFKSCPRVGGIVRGSRRCQWPVAGFKSCPRVGGIVCHSGANAARSVSSRAPVWGASIPFG